MTISRMEEWFLFKVSFPLNSFFSKSEIVCILAKCPRIYQNFEFFVDIAISKILLKLIICWKKHQLHTNLTFDQLFIKTGNLLKMTNLYYWKKHQLHTNLTFDQLFIKTENLPKMTKLYYPDLKNLQNASIFKNGFICTIRFFID